MKVTIVILCYNEKNTMEKIVEAVRTAPLESREVVVVDACSQDGTQVLLERAPIAWIAACLDYHRVSS
jgi:glycosyltransferase involved in cell wall biosynthesis